MKSREEVIRSILDDPGIVVIIGGIDTGKTMFALQLINESVKAGIATAIVDSDVGQSEIGPPTTIGMATIDCPIESMKTLKARRMYFVGDTTPVGNLLPTTIGTKRMVDDAKTRGSELIVVDTSGLIDGIMGRRLKQHKIELVCPKHIVGIQKRREIDHILAPLHRMGQYKISEIEVSPEARPKNQSLRAARRQTRFYNYFKNADRQIIRLDDITCLGTFFTCGKPISWQRYRSIEKTLRSRVLHAEIVGDGMYIVTKNLTAPVSVRALEEQFGSRKFTVVSKWDFNNLLVGFLDETGSTPELGIIEEIDFETRQILVITPLKSIAPVRIVQFGALKIRRDGMQLSKVRPGEL